MKLIQEYQTRIQASGDVKKEFRTLATQFSDCSSAKQGGDLGPFGRGQMQKPFEDASYATLCLKKCFDQLCF